MGESTIGPIKGTVLAGFDMERLAERQMRAKRSSRGIRYIQKKKNPDKEVARQRVVSMCGLKKFPTGLSILTMPSHDWSFERQLIMVREGERAFSKGKMRVGTHICGIEENETIYRTALMGIPGAGLEKGIVRVDAPEYATASHRTRILARFHRGDVFDLMWWYLRNNGPMFDAAWLDFVGYVSISDMAVISRFWESHIKSLLVITSFNGRQRRDTIADQMAFDSIESWMLSKLPDARLSDVYAYGSMIQVAFSKAQGLGDQTEARRRNRANTQIAEEIGICTTDVKIEEPNP